MAFSEVCKLLPITRKQDSKQVKKLIQEKSLYYATDEVNNTLLHHAAECGNHVIVQYLVDSGSLIDARNDFGKTPLMSALESDFPRKKVIQILYEAGSDVFTKDNSGNNAVKIIQSIFWLRKHSESLHIYKMFLEKASYFRDFHFLATGRKKLIKKLLDTNIALTTADSYGNTLIHCLAQNQNDGIMSLLPFKSFDIDMRNIMGWTPLMDAAFFGAYRATKYLLDQGANVEAMNTSNKTALYMVCENIYFDEEDKKCVQLLLEHGANAQFYNVDTENSTIFDVVLKYKSFAAGELILAQLALQEASGTVIFQISRNKINAHDRFKTYFEKCKEQLTTKVYRSITLFHVLTVTDKKVEYYVHDKSLASKFTIFSTIDYFNKILHRRLSRATSMVKIRKNALPFIGKLININYLGYPLIAHEIISYLDKNEIDNLTSVFNSK